MGIVTRAKKGLLRGSFTVELALLMPLILFVVLSVISLSLFMHHKVWLTAAAYEAACFGASEQSRLNADGIFAARQRAKERFQDFFERDANEGLQVVQKGKEIQVSYTGKIQTIYGGALWRFKADGKCRICRPAAFIRKVRLAKNVGDALGGL